MITASAAAPQPRWQALWRAAITDPAVLLRRLGLEPLLTTLPADAAGFALRVPEGFVARMRHGDARDPLLLQVLPQLAETQPHAAALQDAVGDAAARAATGVIHKYHGRALLIASGACAVHCRYCFRRHFPYADETAAANHWQSALEWLQRHPEVDELILSGGDPLALTTAKLTELTDALRALPQLRRLRIHTRLPVVLPQRVDDELSAWLAALSWPVAIVLHSNHPAELDTTVATACDRLRRSGAQLLNQAVLLKGINDDADTLAMLSARLFEMGVLPYYLHQLDRVQGAMHFEVSDEHALALIATLRTRLPGYLLPRLVREQAGAAAKTPLAAP